MAKTRFLFRGSDLDVDGNTFYREQLLTVGEGDTVERCIFWAQHWTANNQGWTGESPNNSTIHSLTFTEGPNTAPVPTPPQPSGSPLFPGILWWGSIPLTFNNWNISSGSSVNNQWLTTPAEGIQTRGARTVDTGNFGGIWYQLAQYKHDATIPFNIWSTRVSIFAVILESPFVANRAERRGFYQDQVSEQGLITSVDVVEGE